MGKIQVLKSGISLLKWQVPKGKINPETLGYVLPNGNINFASNEAAMNYAKKAVVRALKSEFPYERGIVVNNRQIIADIKGTGNQVNFGKMNIENCSVVHGHPNSTPISIGDYDVLMIGSAKENIAYNLNGEYSKLILNSEPKFLDFIPQKIKRFMTKCIHNFRRGVADYEYSEFMKPTDIMMIEKYKSIVHKINEFCINADNKTKKTLAYWVKKIDDDLVKDLSQIPPELQPILKDLFEINKNEFTIKKPLVHKFWLENAEKLGVKYETNFSQLF